MEKTQQQVSRQQQQQVQQQQAHRDYLEQHAEPVSIAKPRKVVGPTDKVPAGDG